MLKRFFKIYPPDKFVSRQIELYAFHYNVLTNLPHLGVLPDPEISPQRRRQTATCLDIHAGHGNSAGRDIGDIPFCLANEIAHSGKTGLTEWCVAYSRVGIRIRRVKADRDTV